VSHGTNLREDRYSSFLESELKIMPLLQQQLATIASRREFLLCRQTAIKRLQERVDFSLQLIPHILVRVFENQLDLPLKT